jgi:CPA1 family monovalent cation:H+ antiporter
LIGNQGRALAMSVETREHVDTFREMIDEVLNAVRFVLIGFEILVVPFNWGFVIAGLAAIPIMLLARWISVASVVGLLSLQRPIASGTIPILTLGGLRGGISVALALSLPALSDRSAIVAMTCAVVVFSIIVQGLIVGKTDRAFSRNSGSP